MRVGTGTPQYNKDIKMTMKKCSKCKVEKDRSEFGKNSTQKDGLHHYCKYCHNLTAWKAKNPTKDEAEYKPQPFRRSRPPDKPGLKYCNKCQIHKPYGDFNKHCATKDGLRSECRECSKMSHRDYWERNRDKCREKAKLVYRRDRKYYQDYYRDYMRDRRANDVQFKLAHTLRTRINGAISNDCKAGSTVRDLGCTIEELKTHLESQFEEGMTWDNWGVNGWHIEHIYPLFMVDLEDRQQFLEVCHYTNLRPMWGSQNQSRKYEEYAGYWILYDDDGTILIDES